MNDPASKDQMPSYRDRVLKCLNDNLSTAAVIGMGVDAFRGGAAGARLGAMAGAPFEGLGAVPGALAGGFAGAVTGAAAGGLKGELGAIGACLVAPRGIKPQ